MSHSTKVVDAAKALFKHNAVDEYADEETVEACWMLDEKVQEFWIRQVQVVQEALA